MDFSLAKTQPNLRSGHRAPAAKTDEYLFSQLIPYLGNKRKLLGLIDEVIALTGHKSGLFADLFAGSGVVSRFAKQRGFAVIANDWEPYSFEINNCFIAANSPPQFAELGGPANVLETLNNLSPNSGWVTKHLCPIDDHNPNPKTDRMFFTRTNGGKIDSVREQIAAWDTQSLIDANERSYLLAPLLFGASYVSNTSGLFKGFHNGWGGKTQTALYRILSKLELRSPVLFDCESQCQAWQLDAQEASHKLKNEFGEIEIAYLDPPYNQHPYGSNYHVLNSIALWDKPELTQTISHGQKSAIRTDWRTDRRSAYNYRSEATKAFGELIQTISAKSILISYSTDGIINLRDMLDIAGTRGHVNCVLKPYKRYRVSTQRMSAKPMNVEFVLAVDTTQGSNHSAVDVYDQIMLSKQNLRSV